MSVGPAEILVILIVALLVFGPQRLPEVGRQVGAAVRELRKMQDAVRGELDMVLHPEHGTRSSDIPSDPPALGEPAEPGDHTISSGDVTSVEVTHDVTSVEAGPDALDEERRFLGPPDSFI
jgi:TatA/E family protein of Tat protein translocase